VEDFEYVSGLGTLDTHNGRFAVTPEYPGGTYAYYMTINSDGSSAYPYIIGPTYYGVVVTENISSNGHVTVTESVNTYNPTDQQPLSLIHHPIQALARWCNSLTLQLAAPRPGFGNFGDGDSSTTKNPTHAFAFAGYLHCRAQGEQRCRC